MTGKILENRETRNTPHIYDLAIISYHMYVYIFNLYVL